MTVVDLELRSRGADRSPRRSPEQLRALAEVAGAELELAPAQDIVAWAAQTFGARFCVTSSMTDAVLAHLASRVAPGVEVVFLDTGYHFAETIGTRDAVAATLPVEVVTVRPELSAADQDQRYGSDLWARDPDLCCAMRKVEPLRRALVDYDGWATGLRRDETRSRVIAPVVGWDAAKAKVKVSPLARWSQVDVDAYVAEHGVLVNPLVGEGYPSIGCRTCTQRVAPDADARSGRWVGSTKTECGIHA